MVYRINIDGAAALILMSASKVKALGITPLAKVVSYADAALVQQLNVGTQAIYHCSFLGYSQGFGSRQLDCSGY